MRKLATIVLIMMGVFELSAQGRSDTTLVVECGALIEMVATPFEEHHFVQWSDGNTDLQRVVEVNDDMSILAFFASDCEEYANWPVVALYDWLLMLNVKEINDMGYYPVEENVRWYRVVEQPDDMHQDVFPQDDRYVCTGYYLTIDRSLKGTGDYYCVADVSDSQGMLCDGFMRSVIAHYAYNKPHKVVGVSPSIAQPGETIRVSGLVPTEKTAIAVFDATGRLVNCVESEGEEYCDIEAVGVNGCYGVSVRSESVNESLRYIVVR